jgi:hypothetical protein
MEDRLKKLEDNQKIILRFIESLKSLNTIDPQVSRTIVSLIGNNLTLASLSDVSDTPPSSGQVLKYNGTEWAPGTDIDT